MRRFAEEDLVRRCRLLEALRDVDRATGHDQMALQVVAGHDLTGVDPDAPLQTHAPVSIEVLVELRERLAHLGGSPHCTQGVVLVQDGHAEDRHDGVADELLDDATVPRHRGLHRPEVVGHEQAQRFRFELETESRRLDQVREEDGDGLSHFPRDRLCTCSGEHVSLSALA